MAGHSPEGGRPCYTPTTTRIILGRTGLSKTFHPPWGHSRKGGTQFERKLARTFLSSAGAAERDTSSRRGNGRKRGSVPSEKKGKQPKPRPPETLGGRDLGDPNKSQKVQSRHRSTRHRLDKGKGKDTALTLEGKGRERSKNAA